MFPPVLLMQPEVARSLLQYRFDRISAAEAKAKAYTTGYNKGLKGSMFPWQSAMTGVECTPAFAGYGRDKEIHISGDIALATWMYYKHGPSSDLKWLQTTGWPLLQGICDFWMSKIAIDNPGAATGTPLYILQVVGPDEYHTSTNNSAFTSAVAILTLRAGAKAAALLSQPAAISAPWQDAAERLVVPYNASVPGYPGGLRPEYSGYVLGTKVKQADTIMLTFPLGFRDKHTSDVLTANDLEYYGQHTDNGGPAMTWALFAIGYIPLGQQYALKAAQMFNKSFANVHQPFGVWMETPAGGTPNFITGAFNAIWHDWLFPAFSRACGESIHTWLYT
jgi:trehalose/maltose hydrolase-like predicted phosphorylase